MKIVVAGGTGTIGQLIVAAGRERGYDMAPLARSTGANVLTGEGLDAALAGADAVIDVTNTMTLSAKKARAFFGTATSNLLASAQRTGVGHHVALSIVGIDRADASYYAGKLEQERLVESSLVPHTIARAAQFHEFAAQILAGSNGPFALVPRTLMRPVAAHDVAVHLLEVADSAPTGRSRDLVGPRDEVLVDLARKYLAHRGERRRAIEVRLPGRYGANLASGDLRGTDAALQTTVTFDEWLAEQPTHP